MHPSKVGANSKVLQILGGLGSPNAQTYATQLTQRLAELVGGVPILLPAPGITMSPDAKRVLMGESYVREATSMFDFLDLALVGIGAIEPSRFLVSSGNVFSPQELKTLQKLGAVGDICLQFFDAEGTPIRTSLSDRVIGISLQQLKKTKRVVGIAGGKRKTEAILGALKGRWIDVLITDRWTASSLLGLSK
jgi:DNA-binding transcriptional regulator LsrR (DeoR family)